MLDTLKLSLTDFEIAGNACLDVMQGSVNASTGEQKGQFPLWHNGQNHVVGSKAFYNADDYNVTVQPVRDDEPMSIGCYVQFSVPKVANGSNYQPADFTATKNALKTIHSELKRIGIKTNLKTAALSRVDSCKTIVTSEPYAAYHRVLLSVTGTDLSIKRRDYGSTFLWHNTQQQICVYDKIKEMKARKHSTRGLPPNSIRFEHRMLKARKIRDAIGLANVKDLLGGFEQIEMGYNKAMRKRLFHYSVAEVEAVTSRSLAEQLIHLRDSGSRYFLRDFLTALGAAEMAGNMEALLNAVETVTDSRATYHRTRKQLDNAQHQALRLQNSKYSRRTLKDLYQELERGVLAA
jgi:hypothetical protein